MYKILIVEDDRVIAQALASHLGKWNYETKCVDDFKNIVDEFRRYDPQLVLLDIMLPFFNGFHWCQEIRKVSEVPIIFLSSANDNMNIVMAMNMGGDEFIEKPFDECGDGKGAGNLKAVLLFSGYGQCDGIPWGNPELK